jgi:hypothetical protein
VIPACGGAGSIVVPVVRLIEERDHKGERVVGVDAQDEEGAQLLVELIVAWPAPGATTRIRSPSSNSAMPSAVSTHARTARPMA